ncbi:MAG: CU044_2847 family protein [Cyanobacteria bacterium J06626_18]
MEEKVIAQFELEDGSNTTALFAVPVPNDDSALEEVGLDAGQMVYKATQTLGQALDAVQPVAGAIISRFKSGLMTPADEVEVKFGLTLSADAGAIFSSVGGDVNFEITLKWTRD